MTAKERIEEAHGVWELAIQRVAAIAEVSLLLVELRPGDKVAVLLSEALATERQAFAHWRLISAAALSGVP